MDTITKVKLLEELKRQMDLGEIYWYQSEDYKSGVRVCYKTLEAILERKEG